jgi:hypothetical protein
MARLAVRYIASRINSLQREKQLEINMILARRNSAPSIGEDVGSLHLFSSHREVVHGGGTSFVGCLPPNSNRRGAHLDCHTFCKHPLPPIGPQHAMAGRKFKSRVL